MFVYLFNQLYWAKQSKLEKKQIKCVKIAYFTSKTQLHHKNCIQKTQQHHFFHQIVVCPIQLINEIISSKYAHRLKTLGIPE